MESVEIQDEVVREREGLEQLIEAVLSIPSRDLSSVAGPQAFSALAQPVCLAPAMQQYTFMKW